MTALVIGVQYFETVKQSSVVFLTPRSQSVIPQQQYTSRGRKLTRLNSVFRESLEFTEPTNLIPLDSLILPAMEGPPVPETMFAWRKRKGNLEPVY
jgi:hypothetical protein